MIMSPTNAQLTQKVEELEAWKAQIVTDLREEANQRGWCSEFQQFMKDHDVPSDPVPHEAEIEGYVTFKIRVDAVDDDDAEEVLQDSDKDQAIRDAAIEWIRAHGLDSWDVNSVEPV